MEFNKKKYISLIIGLCFLTLGFGQENTMWFTDYEKVYAKSVKENKPIMANFTGSDWCGWCKKLKKAVFDTKVFQDWASKNVVLFELDYPRRTPQSEELKKQNGQLQQTFGRFVRGYPTVLIFKIERTFKDDGTKDRDNILLLPNTQLVMSGQGRLGYMPDPNSFIKKASGIINAEN